MTSATKVLMLVENVPVPTDPRVWLEAVSLREHGFQVNVICPKGLLRQRESYICIDNIHIYRYNLPQIKNKYTAYLLEYSIAIFMTFWLSLKVLFRHGFDVIHTANPPDLFFVIGLFYRLFGKKFVFDQHDLAPEIFQIKFKGHMKLIFRLLVFLERCSYKSADLVIVVNESLKRIAIKRGRCPADKVFIVRNGPNLKYLEELTLFPELKRGRRYLLAYLGTMGVQDGVEYALYALDVLVHKRGRQDVSLILLGDGDNAPTLHKLAKKLQLDEYVNFTGWVESKDISGYLTEADIGLSPDPQNGMNEYASTIKTMEYMVMGKPVVAFDLAETHLLAQDAALYATPNLVEDFASKIEVLLDDEELRFKMGAVGHKRITEELSWKQSEKELLRAYQVLLHSIQPTHLECK